ncbi:hypothetical protein FAZ19_23535 [Sphingobacterium alkalisoli]|uniref:Uncharacterized protein n=1 Tax=Sphingobacterium alkalisoli TaxID=1874115 RepID=A0A4U0GN14_9SPHI|nr:hypothetical protein [Sphingobacterium alkalisoli]TJY59714.1 hypothetical protein FAZ19_23535 [Sphingobacterium alkalisoli]GGH32999.1 hypothetical protein GCM10011418_46910 [Sphingobacterium alkalisoli]
MVELYNIPSQIYVYFIGIITVVVFISEWIKYFIVKKALKGHIKFELKQNGCILLDYTFLRFSSGKFDVAWFYFLYPHLATGLHRNRYYVDLKVKDAQGITKVITVRIQSVYFFQVENITYAPVS